MADTCRYAAGRYLNHLSRARSVVASSAQIEFPIQWAYDKDATRPWIAVVDAVDVTVRADLAFDDFGDFEGTFVAGIPPGFTSRHGNLGSSSAETVAMSSGLKALKLNTTLGIDVAEVSRDYAVSRGEELVITADLRSDGVARVSCRVYDLQTRRWWNGTAWVLSEAEAFYTEGLPWSPKAVVVPIVRGPGDFSIVRISFRSITASGGGAAVGWVDNFWVHPSWDCGAIIGHNIDSGTPVSIEESTNGASYTTVAFARTTVPSCYALAPARRTSRWAGFKFPGTNYGDASARSLYAGELIIAQLWNPGSSWSNAFPVSWMPKQLRHQTPAGRTHVTALSANIPRRIQLDLELLDDNIRNAFRDDLALRTNLGEHYALVVPDTALPDVYYGRVTGGLDSTRTAASAYEKTTITLEEDGFPTVGLGT